MALRQTSLRLQWNQNFLILQEHSEIHDVPAGWYISVMALPLHPEKWDAVHEIN